MSPRQADNPIQNMTSNRNPSFRGKVCRVWINTHVQVLERCLAGIPRHKLPAQKNPFCELFNQSIALCCVREFDCVFYC